MSLHPFRLTTLLRLRQRERDEAATSVADARRALDKLDEQANAIHLEQSELDQLRSKVSVGLVLPQKLLDIQRYQLILAGQLQQVAQHRQQIDEELLKREQLLVAAQQAVKSLEQLRDRQQQEATILQQRRQQAQLDEFANTQAVLSRNAKTVHTPFAENDFPSAR